MVGFLVPESYRSVEQQQEQQHEAVLMSRHGSGISCSKGRERSSFVCHSDA